MRSRIAAWAAAFALVAGTGTGAPPFSQLEAKLNTYLKNARAAGTWSRLVVKYLGEKALAVLGRAGKR